MDGWLVVGWLDGWMVGWLVGWMVVDWLYYSTISEPPHRVIVTRFVFGAPVCG